MTLIEVSVALAIAAAIGAAALAVSTTVSRGQTVDQQQLAASSLEANLQGLLLMDLANASHFRNTDNGFALLANARLDAVTFEFQHLPTTVFYEKQRIGPRSWLVRRQEFTDKGEHVMTELICAGVGTVGLQSVEPVEQADEKANEQGWLELPSATTVTVGFDTPRKEEKSFNLRTR